MKKKFLFYPTIKDLLNNENNGSPISQSVQMELHLQQIRELETKSAYSYTEAQINQMVQLQKYAHESTHATDVIWDIIGGVGQGYDQGNEPYAYLLGWIAGKVGQFMIDYLRDKENGRKEE